MPLTFPPDQWSARLEWGRWHAHVRRLKVSIATLVGIGLLTAATTSVWPLLLLVPGILGLRRWKDADERRIAASLTPPPSLPSEADDWDQALRMRTGKSQRELEQAMRQLMADEATRRYIDRQRGQ